jgi:hypothetical protein
VEELAAALAPLATMHERFRGRSTGAFSRRLLEDELAQQAKKPARTSAPLATWQSTVAALPGLVGWLRGRAIPTYLAMAVASALVVWLCARWIGGVRWMEPPPKAAPVRAEPLTARSQPLLRERSRDALRTSVESVLPLAGVSSSATVPMPRDDQLRPFVAEPASEPPSKPRHRQAQRALNRRHALGASSSVGAASREPPQGDPAQAQALDEGGDTRNR